MVLPGVEVVLPSQGVGLVSAATHFQPAWIDRAPSVMRRHANRGAPRCVRHRVRLRDAPLPAWGGRGPGVWGSWMSKMCLWIYQFFHFQRHAYHLAPFRFIKHTWRETGCLYCAGSGWSRSWLAQPRRVLLDRRRVHRVLPLEVWVRACLVVVRWGAWDCCRGT